MLDELYQEGFPEYRMKEAEIGARFFHEMLTSTASPEYLKGAASMMLKIIKIPLDLAKTKEEEEHAQFLYTQMLNAFESKIMRRFLEE